MAIVHANAQTFPQEVLQSSETVLVDFWAAWCGPCKMLAPILEELDGVAPCKIVKVDVDENRALALQYAVASIPTLLVFRNGQLVNHEHRRAANRRVEHLDEAPLREDVVVAQIGGHLLGERRTRHRFFHFSKTA